MSSLKNYLQSIRQYSLPKTRALEQELDVARKAHAAVTADLAEVQEKLQRTHEDDAQSIADLQQQVRQIESERGNALERVGQLQRSLEDAGQSQRSTEEHVASLEATLEEERSSARAQAGQLGSSLADAEQSRKSTEEHVTVLEVMLEEERGSARARVEQLQRSLEEAEQSRKTTAEQMAALEATLEEERSSAHIRVEQLQRSLEDAEQSRKSTAEQVAALEAKLEGERSSAHARLEQLQRSLADAEQNQKSKNEHVSALETMLEDEHKRHEANMQATEARQAQIQTEQQTQLTRQTELASTFHRVSTRLFESQQEGNKKQRYLLWQLVIIAGVLFVAGTVIGVLFTQGSQDSDQEISTVERNIDDMRGFIKQHIDNQDTMLNELAQTLDKKTSAEQLLLGGKPLQLELLTQGTDTQQQEAVTFTPDIRELQAGLIALGFDLGLSLPNGELGIKTRQALQEFRQFYLPQGAAQDDLISEALMVQILNSANLARADAALFNIDSDVLAAIRLGSIHTGVDFSFLMELARVESNFNPAARAPKSSATGLFQFKSSDWLEVIRTFGASYGLQDFATRVASIDTEDNELQPIMHDPLKQEVLALRLNPRLSTLLMAETIKRNFKDLSARTGLEPGRTDLYLSHFLGTDGAVTFLKTLDEEPTAIAGDMFTEAAADNPGVFQNRQQQPRSVAIVYQRFDRWFNTARYDDRNPG